jgi:hypothetical protein
MKEHYGKTIQPFDLFKHLKTSGDPLIDFLRMDIIKRAFRLGVKYESVEDMEIDCLKIIDEAKRLIKEITIEETKNMKEVERDVNTGDKIL